MTALLLAVAAALAQPPSCEGCHAGAHRAWARSRHATAYTNPAFQAAFDRWPDPWCTSCHRPEGGVGCVDCHLHEARIASPRPPSARATAEHDLVYLPDLGTRACIRCHQFDAPGGGGAVQTTADEHAAWQSHAGERSCASCHGGGHDVPASRDPERLRAALSVAFDRGEDGARATITAQGIGHRFPTGDPWRRLVFELLRGEEVAARWTLARRVEGVGAGFREASDGRLPPPDRDGLAAETIRLGDGRGAERWRLSYLRTDPSHGELPAEEVGFVVAEGLLPGAP